MIMLGLLLFVFQTVSAQDRQGPFSFELSAGSGPILQPGNLKTYFKPGFSLQTALKADAGSFVSFRLNVHYLPFKLNSDRVVEEREPLAAIFSSLSYEGGTRHAVLSGLDLLIYLNGSGRTVRPYLFGGGGYALIIKKDIVIREVLASGAEFEHPLDFTENENFPSVYGGLGFEGGGNGMCFYLEAEYTVMMSEELESGWPDDYVEHALYSPSGPTQMVFIHAGLRIGL